MVSALDSRSSGPGLSSGRGHCVVFLGKTRNTQDTYLTSLHLTSPRFHRAGRILITWGIFSFKIYSETLFARKRLQQIMIAKQG